MQLSKSIRSIILIFCLLTAFTTAAIFHTYQRGSTTMLDGYILYSSFNSIGLGPIPEIVSMDGYSVNLSAGQVTDPTTPLYSSYASSGVPTTQAVSPKG